MPTTAVAPTGPWAVRSQRFIRRFYIAVVLLCAITIVSLVTDQIAQHHGMRHGRIQQRAVIQSGSNGLFKRDEECRLVHDADNKCAFIKANCPDEEAGLMSYLSLYYCTLVDAQPAAFIILVIWIGLLFSTIGIAASDFFCVNLSTIAGLLGMSESMAGVTFLAFGNGSPDVFSTFAAMSTNSGSLAVGELMGAAGFITAVVAGSMALVREFKVGRKTFVRDIGFFIIAASFTTYFLADGRLQLWECIVMVVFYVFYVVTVVVWHWYFGKKQAQREREAAARSHVHAPGIEDIEVPEEAEDEDAGESAGLLGGRQEEDWAELERGNSRRKPEDDSDNDDDPGRLLATEVSNSMRITRPRGTRRNTLTPIRPSLVGALEFRSVLASLQRSRSIHAAHIHLRRYSDEHAGPSSDHLTPTPTNLLDDDISEIGPLNGPTGLGVSNGRGRAVSMNDAAEASRPNPAAYSVAKVPKLGVIAATPMLPSESTFSAPEVPRIPDNQSHVNPPSPTISVSPPPSSASRSVSPSSATEGADEEVRFGTFEGSNVGAQIHRSDTLEVPGQHYFHEPSPRSKANERPRLHIPGQASTQAHASNASSPLLQFPAYTDSPLPISSHGSRAPSLFLPEPSLATESEFISSRDFEEASQWYIKWWPYKVLPRPELLLSMFFPTLYMWRSKSIWDKVIGILSAPSIFFLSITLPVVELESSDEDEEEEAVTSRPGSQIQSPLILSPSIEARMEPEWHRYRRSTQSSYDSRRRSIDSRGLAGHGNAAEVAVSTEHLHHHSHHPSHPHHDSQRKPTGSQLPQSRAEAPPPSSARDWNRWLIIIQIFTAPFFVVTIIWANNQQDLRQYIRLVLYSLLGSLVALLILLLTTTAEKPPKWRSLLSFFGFVVSIAWISTIANEVVGVLKAFGVILGISDAILGLTIFAVGNSLGDLVADITVARLGYPVMALSACFGGPMLNILLGIGISGVYMTTTRANHKHEKHPSRPIEYRPYEIEISPTLIISAITLVVTLISLLVVVPMSKWIMTRRVGWGLIGLWTVSTILNLIVEATGVLASTSAAAN